MNKWRNGGQRRDLLLEESGSDILCAKSGINVLIDSIELKNFFVEKDVRLYSIMINLKEVLNQKC
jgi:hypothetical protein